MNPSDAIRLMVKHYPGGLEVISLRIGKNPETFRKEMSGDAKFKLGLLDSVMVSDLCIEAKSEHCHDFVNAIAASGGGFVRLPVLEMNAPVNLQRGMSDVIKEMSDVATATIAADADGVISDNDKAALDKEIAEARESLQKLEQSIHAKHEAGKPMALRAVG